jgi:hypothetical protein
MTYTITRENGFADAMAIQAAIHRLVADGGQGSALVDKLREMRDQIEQAKPAVDPTEDYRRGVLDTVARGTRVLEAYRKGAITATSERCYQNAINVLRELA